MAQVDFRMMSRLMVDSILEIREYNRYMKGYFHMLVLRQSGYHLIM